MQTQIAEREAAIQALLEEDAQGQQLHQSPSIGPHGAATLRADLGEVTRFSRVDAVVASSPRRLCRPGPAHAPERRLRGPEAPLQARTRRAAPRALYLAACVAARCAPEWRVRSQRLRDRGRAKKEAFTILARALLRVIYHLLRTGDAYDPARLNQPPAPAAG